MKKIRIVSPAKSIEKRHVLYAQSWLEQKDFDVSIGKNALGEYNYFSGTDEQRLDDFQDAIDSDVDVILCARGGYGSVRIVDQIDWTNFYKKPKLICGYSDVTVFHNRINKMGFSSIHSTAPLNFEENSAESLDSLINLISGKLNDFKIEHHELNKMGQTEAEVVGGNLAILSTLSGTDDDLNTENKILFIEDIGEAVYSIDRMMWQLKKSGKLAKIKGLIVGGLTAMKDSAVPFGNTAEEVIADAVKSYEYPVCFNFPAGHVNDNRAILFGKLARLDVQNEFSNFTQTGEGV